MLFVYKHKYDVRTVSIYGAQDCLPPNSLPTSVKGPASRTVGMSTKCEIFSLPLIGRRQGPRAARVDRVGHNVHLDDLG